MKLLNKKAAMFGIDARIALIIFSILAIVSSATIYSAIEKAEISRIIQQVEEVKKAEARYYHDTGTIPPQDSIFNLRKIRYLLENSNNVPGWKGPYLPLADGGETKIYTPEGEFITLRIASDEITWGENTNIPIFSKTCTNYPCNYFWIQVEVDSYEIADGIKAEIDGNNDRDFGNVRVRNIGVIGTTKPSVFIKHRVWEEF
tara:strand:- start:4 stop:609 length:606 start_codon:yes stop_codon:yes gene_type:complete